MKTLPSDYNDFTSDEFHGELAVQVFRDWLNKNKITYRETSMTEQHKGIDIITAKRRIEVKYQSFEKSICIEETSMPGVQGWIYTSEADTLIEVYKDRITAIPMEQLRKVYLKIKKKYDIIKNKKETKGKFGDIWWSTFRVIPYNDLKPYVSMNVLQDTK